MTTELRRHLRVRALVPVACSFVRIGLQQWLAAERAGLGFVLDVSLNSAKVMSAVSMNPGDQLAFAGSDCDDECRCDGTMWQSSHIRIRIYRCLATR